MIASFFQHLDEHEVRWLLISGQATILYGAATFSEDVDLWVDPEGQNLERMKGALHASEASYYKLTPPLNAHFAERHHGFHFTVPDDAGGVLLYLDVMACPPRVGSFEEAWQRRSVFETEWGALNTVSIVDLVELKKTQRAPDYPIIGRLALAFLEHRGTAATSPDRRWALENVFGVAEFTRLVREYPAIVPEIEGDVPRRAAERISREGELPPELEDELEEFFDAKVAPLRKADRRFWRTVIDELRELRTRGELMQVGQRV
jgi:hypothetical protein